MTPNRPPGPHSRTQPNGPPSRLQDPLIVAFGLTLAGPLHVANAERNQDRVREELFRRCRAERIEPPTSPRVTRIVRSALHNAEETWS